MAETKVIMPQMGESIFEGTLTRWLKKPGDAVKRDEPLFEISTDKIDSEIPAPASADSRSGGADCRNQHCRRYHRRRKRRVRALDSCVAQSSGTRATSVQAG